MSTPASRPPWLSAACATGVLGDTLRVLAAREQTRERLRGTSRQTSRANNLRSTLKSQITGKESSNQYSVATGSSEENSRRNRYYQLEPYDRTRVVLSAGDGTSATTTNAPSSQGRYLNASWILEHFGHKWWIATQAPLPNTAHTFLSMISHPVMRPPPALLPPASYPPYPTTRIRTVVQLTNIIESGRRKAHAYFPSAVGKFIIVPAEEDHAFPALKVTLLHLETIQDANCVKSTISVVPVTKPPSRNAQTFDYMDEEEYADGKDRYGEQSDARVIFTHLLYTSWPDHGVPEAEDRTTLLQFLRLTDRINRDTSLSSYPPTKSDVIDSSLDPDPPIIVGCSAGVGRTGTFIALSSLLRDLNELPPPAFATPSSVLPPSPLGPLPERFRDDRVAVEIDSLREQRQRMVERQEQAILIYEMLLDLYEGS